MDGDVNQPASGNWQYKPNDTDPQPTAEPSVQAPQLQQTGPVAPAAPVVPAPEQEIVAAAPALELHPNVTWTAAEFVMHDKTPFWYFTLIVLTVGLAALVKIVSHDTVSMVLIVIIGVIVWATAGRQPRSLQYLLDAKGITVNRAFRAYGEFKSFAIVQEDQINSIILMPLKRLTLPLSVHVSPEETDQVVAKLSDYLPNDQTHGHDSMDRLVQRLHF